MVREICTFIFKCSGWKYVEEIPHDLRSFVMIGAPHTSNYDFIPGMAVAHSMKRNPKFVIKNDWLKFPFKALFKQAGAVGVNRNQLKNSQTDVMADLFKTSPEFVLMIAPEGTRSPNQYWKTGFYYIAQKANVPIVLGYADYAKKEAGLGKVIYPTDLEKDMREIMNFYRTVRGARPQNFLLDLRYGTKSTDGVTHD